jgi:hypothetical protein
MHGESNWTERMGTSVNRSLNKSVIRCEAPKRTRNCLSCGTSHIKPGRRYCSKACRQQIDWVLSLSKGLLRTFNARYAAFFFTSEHVVLDVLPVWSDEISRFLGGRTRGNKPAKDFKRLILESGREWYKLLENNSKSYAALSLLNKNHKANLKPESIVPNKKTRLKLSKLEQDYLKILQLTKQELATDGQRLKIKSAYKKLAKVYHPDLGGDAEKFKRLNEAHQKMLLWAENPQYTCRKALADCWSYDGAANRWSPPL